MAKANSEQRGERRSLRELAEQQGRSLLLSQSPPSAESLNGWRKKPPARRGRKIWRWTKIHVDIPEPVKDWLREAGKWRPGGMSGIVLDVLQFVIDRPALWSEAIHGGRSPGRPGAPGSGGPAGDVDERKAA